MMNAFVAAIQDPGKGAMTSAQASLESHLMSFAAERARQTGEVLDMVAYRKRVLARAMTTSMDL